MMALCAIITVIGCMLASTSGSKSGVFFALVGIAGAVAIALKGGAV